MAEVRVIARSVARKGREDQLRELLWGMLALTRVEAGCKLYELYESDSEGRFYFHEIWESQAALINTQQVLTSSTWNEPWGD